MATFPQLCECLAPHDGRTVGTLIVVGNHLRSAGLIAGAGARGRGAVSVGPEDCAALVLAGLWTDAPSASPRAVEVLSSLIRRPAAPTPSLPRSLALIVDMPTFGEAVAALIEYGGLVRRQIGDHRIELSVGRPMPTASLSVVDPLGRRGVIAEWAADARRLARGFYGRETREVVTRRHSILNTGEMLFALADLIRPEPEREAA